MASIGLLVSVRENGGEPKLQAGPIEFQLREFQPSVRQSDLLKSLKTQRAQAWRQPLQYVRARTFVPSNEISFGRLTCFSAWSFALQRNDETSKFYLQLCAGKKTVSFFVLQLCPRPYVRTKQ